MTPQRASVDWPRLLADIAYLIGEPIQEGSSVRTPVGTRLLAAFLDRPRSTVVGWTEGQEPRHSDGEWLLERWCELTGKAESFAPITVRSFSASTMRT
jgi:hypothetical protein